MQYSQIRNNIYQLTRLKIRYIACNNDAFLVWCLNLIFCDKSTIGKQRNYRGNRCQQRIHQFSKQRKLKKEIKTIIIISLVPVLLLLFIPNSVWYFRDIRVFTILWSERLTCGNYRKCINWCSISVNSCVVKYNYRKVLVVTTLWIFDNRR